MARSLLFALVAACVGGASAITTISGLPGTFTTSAYCYTVSGTSSVPTPLPTTLRHNTTTLYKTRTSTTYVTPPIVVVTTTDPYTFTEIPYYINASSTSTVMQLAYTTTSIYYASAMYTNTIAHFNPIASNTYGAIPTTRYASPEGEYPIGYRRAVKRTTTPTQVPTKWAKSVVCTDKVTFYGSKTVTSSLLGSTSTRTVYQHVTVPTSTVAGTTVTQYSSTSTMTYGFGSHPECRGTSNLLSGVVYPTSGGQFYSFGDFTLRDIEGYFHYNTHQGFWEVTDAHITSAPQCCDYCLSAGNCYVSAWTEGKPANGSTPAQAGVCRVSLDLHYSKYPLSCYAEGPFQVAYNAPASGSGTPQPTPTIVLSNGRCGHYSL
ncbi:hypothetical protein OC846_005737 [Tilletia horrida]|uniref:Apple domain-containing protein n=1 Tax=Tilletia horrida TaxID=155126 RepID=A0AAN6JVP8_9BASI|nr:hypothetical protein OC846_005737 [Tilletia horrida]KAK0561263.1 hypothetical protein OC861_005906 [Tilletia horrida]